MVFLGHASEDMGKKCEQKAGISEWLKKCCVLGSICFGQHLLARRSAWKLEILLLGTSRSAEALTVLLKSDLIGGTS